MMTSDLAAIFDRELESLAREIEAYDNFDMIWETPLGVTNSAGTLILHLCGNLRWFIGANLGGSDYSRDRDFEFSGVPIGKVELLSLISAARTEVGEALHRLDAAELDGQYPLHFGGGYLTKGQFLLHLLSHCSLHIGQVDYHRRIVTGQNTSVGPVSIRSLIDAIATK
jgi:hypothetical protein